MLLVRLAFQRLCELSGSGFVIRPLVTNFLRECWRTPDGKTLTAPLPAGVDGHFGPELRRFVLAQYHQGQVTAARLVTLLKGFGILISKRQVVRLLIAGKQSFIDEARAVLRAGLTHAAWITVDDTGARHKGKNGFCTQIGNAHFTDSVTTGSKSRLNFLEVLRAGHDDYVVNEQAGLHAATALAGPVIARLSEHPIVFAHRAAWNVHLDQLGVSALKVSPDPCDDRHRRRSVGQRQSPWFPRQCRDRQRRRRPIQRRPARPVLGPWRTPGSQTRYVHRGATRRAAAHPRPDLAVLRLSQSLAPTSFPGAQGCLVGPVRPHLQPQKRICPSSHRLLGRQRANKSELLMVLERPDIPLHTNGSENDVRCQVEKRKISGLNPKRRRPRLPRRLPRAHEDLRQERHPLLGLPGARLKAPGQPGHSQPRANRRRCARAQAPLRAQDFRPLTATCRYARLRLVKPRARNRPRSGRDPGAPWSFQVD